MATGAFTLNTKMQTNLASGLLDFSTGTWKAILLTSTAPVATAETYADVSSYQPSNAGYAEASVSCTVTGSGSNLVSFGDASFTASGGSYTARYIAYYETGALLLAGYMLLDEDAVDITINNGETITISAPNAIVIGTTNVLEVNGQNGVVELDGTNLYVDDNASPLVSIKDELDIKYGTDNPPPYPVTSVNTMTSDVVFEYDHRNLLLNPFFNVNSKGQSTYTIASGAYATVDSWKGQKTSGTDATITVSSNGVSLTNPDTTNTLYFYEDLSSLSSFLNGKSMTASLIFQDDTSADYQFTFNGATVTVANETDFRVRIYVGGSFAFQFCIDVKPTKTLNLKAVKLELGNVSTLAYDIIPNENEQLNLIYGGNAKSNQNLLDNAWFTVNQRGATSYTSAGYTVDRWRTWNNAIQTTVNNDGTLTIENVGTANQQWVQYLPEEDKTFLTVGTTVTLSAIIDGVLCCKTDTLASGASNRMDFSWGYLQMARGNGDLICAQTFVGAGKSFTIKAIKLELGEISTLQYDTAPNYEEELAKCQRYFCRFTRANSAPLLGFAYKEPSQLLATVSTNVPMRIIPSVAFNKFNIYTTQAYAITSVDSVLFVNNSATLTLKLTVSGASLSTGTVGEIYLQNADDSYLNISADL